MNGDQVLQNVITEIFTPLYQLTAGIAILYFLFGVFKYIIDLNHPEEKNVGKQHLLWGTIGLFIILSVGGILKLFNSLFGGMFMY